MFATDYFCPVPAQKKKVGSENETYHNRLRSLGLYMAIKTVIAVAHVQWTLVHRLSSSANRIKSSFIATKLRVTSTYTMGVGLQL